MVVRDMFQRFDAKVFLCAVMAMLADWLFYGQSLGWTVGLYSGIVLGVVLLTQKNSLRSLPSKIVAALCFLLVLQMINAPNILTVIIYLLTLVTMIILGKREKITDATLWIQDTGLFFLHAMKQWIKDQAFISKALSKKKTYKGITPFLRYAALPAALTIIFSFLFIEANPIIANIIQGINFDFSLPPERVLFWSATMIVAWGLLRSRFPLATHKPGFSIANIASIDSLAFSKWLSRNSIVVSLVIFNALFAIQNGLDILFLWRGEALPNGVSHASYARAGAYPLILTTIIAAIYVLVTFGKDSMKYQSSFAHAGVYLWLTQNIFLVFSAINRNIHYIDYYSLTYLRVAALIWMGLVATGAFLVVLRIAMNKDNLWLINTNMVALMGTLYICCFVNFDRMIADYNAHHAREVTGTGAYLDIEYMSSLGPAAIPALEFIKKDRTPLSVDYYASQHRASQSDQLTSLIFNLKMSLHTDIKDNWRTWTWQKQRLFNEIKPFS